MRTEYMCQKCEDGFLSTETTGTYLTSYPIWQVLECPKCGAVHFLLYDKVLCTEEEFDRRICHNYHL